MTETTQFVGRNNDGARCFAQITLEQSGAEVEFTDHNRGTLDCELTISGFVIPKGRTEAEVAGQCTNAIAAVTSPAGGWTAGDIASLCEIWSEWHLNNMNPASDEQRAAAEAAGFDYNALKDLTDSTGYKYGSKWLARQLPDDVVAEVERIQQLPHGDVPEHY